MKDKKFTYHQKKDSKLLMTRFFWHHMEMEYQKITNLLGTTPNEVPR